MSKITSLHPQASRILNVFFIEIDKLTLSNFSQRHQLLKQTKQLFRDLSKIGEEEFAEIFKYNYFNSSDEKDNEKYQEVLSFLATCIIEKYSESDLLRYFLTQNLSQKENRPEYFDHASRIAHWCQLIGYWFRQLSNKSIYKFNPESSSLADSVKHIKTSLNKKSYVENSVDVDFRTSLSKVLVEFEKKLINSQLEGLANEGIIEREKSVARREEILSQKEELLSEKIEGLARSEENLQQKTELLNDERKDLEEKNKNLEKVIDELKEKISALKEVKLSDRNYLHFLEDQSVQLQEELEKLVKELGVFPQASQSTKAKNEESFLAKPKLCRSQSFASFFPKHQSKDDNQSNLGTAKSFDCVSMK